MHLANLISPLWAYLTFSASLTALVCWSVCLCHLAPICQTCPVGSIQITYFPFVLKYILLLTKQTLLLAAERLYCLCIKASHGGERCWLRASNFCMSLPEFARNSFCKWDVASCDGTSLSDGRWNGLRVECEVEEATLLFIYSNFLGGVFGFSNPESRVRLGNQQLLW